MKQKEEEIGIMSTHYLTQLPRCLLQTGKYGAITCEFKYEICAAFALNDKPPATTTAAGNRNSDQWWGRLRFEDADAKLYSEDNGAA